MNLSNIITSKFFNMQIKFIFHRLLLLIILSANAVLARAASVEYVTFTVSGRPVVIALAEHPVITYTANTLHIRTASTSIDLSVEDINDVVFSKATPTGIAERLAAKPQLRGGAVCFEQLPVGSLVTIHALDGTQVTATNADDRGQAEVGIFQLPAGVYIVKSVS